MNCHLCEVEAVTRCHNCGALLCAEHGGKDDDCRRCTTAIAAGDPGGNRISATPLGQLKTPGWWRPQQAEEYQPPACYACQGLTRAVCRNCQNRYCYEHKGPSGLCGECGRSARLGMVIFVGIFSIMLLFCLYHWLFGRY
jgi:hypothetical protein